MWVKFLSRNSEVFKIYTNYLSFLVYNEVYNLFVCTVCPCLTSFFTMNYNEIPACSTCHVSRESAVILDLIALRNSTRRLFLSCEKSRFLTYMLYIRHWMNRQSEFFFFLPCSFTRLVGFLTKPKKILGPKINPPNFQALISPSPEIFPWRIKWYGTPKKEK